MNKKSIAHYMKSQNRNNSYHLSEEIELRKIFKSIRHDFLSDYFNSLFHELSGDVYAQARLVDIGLRYENNVAVNLAAAKKIGKLLDEHKILLIPAHIDLAGPPVAEAIAKQITTIRENDVRQYFLQRGCRHINPAVQRICISALNYYQNTMHTDSILKIESQIAPFVRQIQMPQEVKYLQNATAEKNVTIPQKVAVPHKTAKLEKTPKRAKAAREKKPETVQRKRPAIRIPPQHILRQLSENLIALIETHIVDPDAAVRLKWVKRIGEIPAKKDSKDIYKIKFITAALYDPVQEISVEAIAQIAFLIHDKSKLALLLKIFEIKPDLIRSPEAKTVISSLPPNMQKQLEEKIAFIPTQPVKSSARNKNGERKTGAQSTLQKEREQISPKDTPQEHRIETVTVFENAENRTTRNEGAKTETAGERKKKQAEAESSKPAETTTEKAGQNPETTREKMAPGNDNTEIKEILSELGLSDKALAELKNDQNPASELIKNLTIEQTVPKTDNYFLRHTAVLHVKDLHSEELRFQLYLSVLKHDPKDIVRQIVVHEAQNLHKEHREAILHLGLTDAAWQVRCCVLEDLLPLIADKTEQKNILALHAQDTDYHVRQKVTEKLSALNNHDHKAASPMPEHSVL